MGSSVGDRDYPKGHPAAPDYKGEPYNPPQTWTHDYPLDHPCSMGKNTGPLDTPDGMRAHHLEQEKERAAQIARQEN